MAATAAGIHRTTLHRWMRHGRDQVRGRYRKFLVAVEKAQAESESRDVALVAKARVHRLARGSLASGAEAAPALRRPGPGERAAGVGGRVRPAEEGPGPRHLREGAGAEPEDLRTPEERKRDNEEMLVKLRRLRPDLYARAAELVTGSDEDWFEVLQTRLDKETFLDVLEASVTVEAP